MNFNENQMLAIQHFKNPANIIACAGSGKTSVLTNRIKNLIDVHNVKASNILAITFSRKAKNVMIERLSQLIPFYYRSVNIETFHSLGFKISSNYTGAKLRLLNEPQKIIMLSKLNKSDLDLKTVISYISEKKNNLILPNKRSSDEYEIMYCQYERDKKMQNIIDFDDMLINSYYILSENQDVLDMCTSKYQFILVDEAQDMNMAQYEVLKLIGKPNNNVFIVNDPLQLIYQWRGANNKYVLDFHKDWDDVTVINLDTNYRSTKDIVSFSNKFAKTIKDSHHEFYVESHNDIPNYKAPTFSKYEDGFNESESIGEKINELVSSEQYSYKDFCILARTNAQLQIFESIFYNLNLPYDIVNGMSFIEYSEIKIILSYLRLANDINDNESFANIYNKPNRWLGNVFLEECKAIGMKSLYCSMSKAKYRNSRFTTGVNELYSIIDTLQNKKWKSLKEQIKFLRNTVGVDKHVLKDANDCAADNEKIENLNSLEQISSNFKNSIEFLDYLNHMSAKKNNEDDNTIKLSTIHRIKGLEFPVVFFVGLNDGLLPHKRSDNLEEEKRLTYVAITRAEKELYCSAINSYQGKPVKISPFIYDMFEGIKNKKGNEK